MTGVGSRSCFSPADTSLSRRQALAIAFAAAAASAACRGGNINTDVHAGAEPVGTAGRTAADLVPGAEDPWSFVRSLFDLSSGQVHMSAMLVTSHPRPVREAIERYRREIDADPVSTLEQHNRARQAEARAAAATYLGVNADDIALTDSTTMGVGLVGNGLRLQPDDEILTTTEDYYVTHETLRQAAERYGARVRQIQLFEDIEHVSEDALADRIVDAIGPRTRLVSLTWVHSSTGLKMPVRRLGSAINDVNEKRPPDERVLLAIDGVHGFGIEDITLEDSGIHFFSAGCHKWLFGPRGTGILWGSPEAWASTRPLIPSFIDDGTWEAWMTGAEPAGPVTASRMTPGGFKAFEHQWALPAAFQIHQQIGKAAIQERTHALARQLKEGLRAMPHVRLVTPMSSSLSSGIVSFDVHRMSPWQAVRRLRENDGVVATVTPYAVRHLRLTPSIRNTPHEIERALEAVRNLA